MSYKYFWFALTKNAPNKENAIKLLERYLTGEEAQNTYVNNSYEYPANQRLCHLKLFSLGVISKEINWI